MFSPEVIGDGCVGRPLEPIIYKLVASSGGIFFFCFLSFSHSAPNLLPLVIPDGDPSTRGLLEARFDLFHR